MGRKSLQAEVDTNKLFTLSYHTLRKALVSKKVTFNKKIEIALAVYTKHLPSKLEHSGNIGNEKLIAEEIEIIPVNGGLKPDVKNRITQFINQ